ncbi:glutathione S-transferase N-terminal domain-containing protein [Acinetobacter shaoyimingii]|uniref:glutathione S-transferase N-terminal domain-containing protein n=1 Tax=Acinetobacter shaoyimingii TaxID=2715164 RepID=UPI001D0E89FF|nr:glutathione S-transferase N-terminal domain-containing protein [Acinetobacter shaoyimingii]
MQIKLYHSPNSRSQRIIWLFEELNLDYELITINKSRSTNRSPSNKERVNTPDAVLPLKFPTILINTSDQNIAITESSAIAEFFC